MARVKGSPERLVGSMDDGTVAVACALGGPILGLVLIRAGVVGGVLSCGVSLGVFAVIAYVLRGMDYAGSAYACWDLSQKLGSRVRIGDVRAALFAGTLEARDASLAQLPDFPPEAGNAVEVGEASIRFHLKECLRERRGRGVRST